MNKLKTCAAAVALTLTTAYTFGIASVAYAANPAIWNDTSKILTIDADGLQPSFVECVPDMSPVCTIGWTSIETVVMNGYWSGIKTTWGYIVSGGTTGLGSGLGLNRIVNTIHTNHLEKSEPALVFNLSDSQVVTLSPTDFAFGTRVDPADATFFTNLASGGFLNAFNLISFNFGPSGGTINLTAITDLQTSIFDNFFNDLSGTLISRVRFGSTVTLDLGSLISNPNLGGFYDPSTPGKDDLDEALKSILAGFSGYAEPIAPSLILPIVSTGTKVTFRGVFNGRDGTHTFTFNGGPAGAFTSWDYRAPNPPAPGPENNTNDNDDNIDNNIPHNVPGTGGNGGRGR